MLLLLIKQSVFEWHELDMHDRSHCSAVPQNLTHAAIVNFQHLTHSNVDRTASRRIDGRQSTAGVFLHANWGLKMSRIWAKQRGERWRNGGGKAGSNISHPKEINSKTSRTAGESPAFAARVFDFSINAERRRICINPLALTAGILVLSGIRSATYWWQGVG